MQVGPQLPCAAGPRAAQRSALKLLQLSCISATKLTVSPVEKYLERLVEIRSSGDATDETSYYSALDNLLNEVGKDLKPRVHCILQLKNRGAGHPDGGLYTPDQFQKGDEPIAGQKPSRGALEVKPTKDDAFVTADTEQVTKYWKAYGQVLVTNYRDFVLVGRDIEGKPVKLASYRLASDEKAFWKAAAQPVKVAKEQGRRFVDFLKLAMLSPAVLAAPKDVAWVLAYYAREAKARIDEHSSLPALSTVRAALEQALGLKFEGDKGEHFFRSSLVQTLFYGVFSAWVLWSKQHVPPSKEKFDWKLTQWTLRVPMIRTLFEQVATPGQLGPLRLVQILDWTATALNRIDRADFFTRFQEQAAVQYFYEPFLEAFDPELRKDLGVWYTPLEVVEYMVARADTALREELGLEDGFADKNVYVLDPWCGTGAYLVAVLNQIAATLKSKGQDALAAQTVKYAAMQRVFGFEILPAPFVISHLQLGLLLQNLGAPLAEHGKERVGVYLTNSLTGWEPPKEPKQHLIFPAMEEERDAAETVKHHPKILVIIGNPPYNAFAGVSPAEEEGLVEPYKEGLNTEWGIKKFNLDDLYVRFFRLAERRIAEKTGKGIVTFISNFSYLSDPSYLVMRKRFLDEFDTLWFDSLNGDSRETGKLTPDGKPDPSIFSTESNREGIRVGTAICLMVRPPKRKAGGPTVRYRDFWGTDKRTNLVQSLKSKDINSDYRLAEPTKANRFSLRPSIVAAEYEKWPNPVQMCAEPPVSGLQEMRKSALMDIDKNELEERIEVYFDKSREWKDVVSSGSGLVQNAGRFDAEKARTKLLKVETYDREKIIRYALYPLDSRFAYHTNTRPLWNEPRPALAAQVFDNNSFFVVRMFAERPQEHAPTIVTPLLPDYHLLRPNAVAIPFYVRDIQGDDGHHARIRAREDAPSGATRSNLSEPAKEYLRKVRVGDPEEHFELSAWIWNHLLAVTYSPFYLRENADGIKRDWPRVPLPASLDVLSGSFKLGLQLSALLNTEGAVAGVTAGALRPEMQAIANVATTDGNPVKQGNELTIKVGWGHGGHDGVTMPGKGKLIERDYNDDERVAISEGAAALGLAPDQALAQIGETTCDVYLNERVYWKNIPLKVWEYTIGGYQVIKKWLIYREGKLLGRAITSDEAYYVRDMARRIAAICLLQPALDANYAAVKAGTYPWPTSPTAKIEK